VSTPNGALSSLLSTHPPVPNAAPGWKRPSPPALPERPFPSASTGHGQAPDALTLKA
jgi:hypothetical protein